MSRYFQRQILSILLLPGMVTVVIPGLILWLSKEFDMGWGLPAPWNMFLILAGIFFLIAGLTLMYKTIMLFVTSGKGTLAPWDPPQKLVIRGPYRYVRNPMISGVFAILMAETLIAGSISIVIFFLVFIAINMTYMPLLEEPGLEKRFGTDYVIYKQHVPRWIPRRTPWDGQPKE